MELSHKCDNSIIIFFISGLQFVVAAQNIDNFMLVKLLHIVSCRTKIFTRVKLCRFLHKCLADCSSHCKTWVWINVDLANCRFCRLPQPRLRNTDCSLQSTAVFVDCLNLLLRNWRRTVKHDRETRKFLLNSLKNVECQWTKCSIKHL